MDKIRSLYNKLYAHKWEIGFLDNTIESILNGDRLNYCGIKLQVNDRWFADPFILDVTNSEIILLCEEYSEEKRKGRIAKLIVDRDSLSLKSWKIILELPTHLSFPFIERLDDNKVFIYPENSASGSFNRYLYDTLTDKVVFDRTIINEPLTDAIISNLDGNRVLFSTLKDNPNGNILTILKLSQENESFENKIEYKFEENIARMAGAFFYVNSHCYRPAQESNRSYGHAIDIQELISKGGTFSFKSIRRIESPYPMMKLGFHTLNEYKGLIVVDVKGYRYPRIVQLLTFLKQLFFRV